MEKNIKRAVIFSASTYDDLRAKAKTVLNIFEELLRFFTVEAYQPQSITVHYTNGKISLIKFTPRNFTMIKNKVLANQIAEIQVALDDCPLNDIYSIDSKQPNRIQICIGFCGHQIAQEKKNHTLTMLNGISFMVSEDDLKLFLMQNLKDWFFKICIGVKGLYGYIELMNQTELGVTIFPTPMEWTSPKHRHMGVGLDRRTRGYFWGNILTAGHIEELGGVEYIEQYAPCERIERIHGQDDILFLQLTDSIGNVSPAKYKKLKTFLRPTLPEEDIFEVAKKTYFKQELFNNYRLVFSEEEEAEMNKIFSIPKDEINDFLYPKNNKSENLEEKRDYVHLEVVRIPTPDAVQINISFERIDDDQLKELKQVVEAWYKVGALWGYHNSKKSENSQSLSGFHMLNSIYDEEDGISLSVDMGNSNLENAITAFEAMINQFAFINDLKIFCLRMNG